MLKVIEGNGGLALAPHPQPLYPNELGERGAGGKRTLGSARTKFKDQTCLEMRRGDA